MTPKDIFIYLTLFIMSLPPGSFVAALVAGWLRPQSMLERSTNELFTVAIWLLGIYAVLVVLLMAAWGVIQVIASSNIFYLDGKRMAAHRLGLARLDEYTPLEFTVTNLPEPRRSNLDWLDEEINEILAEGGKEA